MSSESVQPLRIAKSAPNTTTPAKMASAVSRPLAELSPSEQRRNSPNWHQASPTKKSVLSNDSSPFQSSPLDTATSPRLFWQNRNSENILYGRNGSPSPTRRSSIERLQKASRVKNSNILALEQKQEYDPTRIPQIERPLAKVQDNAFGFRTPKAEKRLTDPLRATPKQPASSAMTPIKGSPSEAITGAPTKSPTPSKDQASPTKSSLSPSKFKSSFDHETGVWSPESSVLEDRDIPHNRSLHRHTKSVTFDAAPPQINEYEMATPDLSSIGTNSREGSYDSMDDDDEEDILYDPGNVDGHDDDSFDASLEDTDKTPVVGPDDWESPVVSRRRESEQFEGSPMLESTPSGVAVGRHSLNHQRTDSASSPSDHRPLPPLPGFNHTRSQSTGSAPTSPGLSATAERMLGNHRSLPPPPPASASKSDIQSFISGKMTLEERLKLMMLSDDNSGKSAAEQQRERRLRRLSGRDRSSLGSRGTASRDITPNVTEVQGHREEQEEDEEDEDENVGDISELAEYETPPRITRESIMRRMNGNKTFDAESDYTFSSPPASPGRQLPLDPDVPIPSTEDSIIDDEEDDEEDSGSVIITRPIIDDDEDDSVLDLYHDSDLEDELDDDEHGDRRFKHEEALAASRSHYDDESHYSDQEEVLLPPKAVSAPEEVKASRETTPAATPVVQQLQPQPQPQPQPTVVAEPETPSIEVPEKIDVVAAAPSVEVLKETAPVIAEKTEELPRQKTPEKLLSRPVYDGSGWGEPEDESYEDEDPGTPESVIRHPISDDDDDDEYDETLDDETLDEETLDDETLDDETLDDELEEEEEDEDYSDLTERNSPAIPEEIATIKASGSKLKTRVSNTPSDITAMREARRQVSGEIPNVPSIPERHRSHSTTELEAEFEGTHEEFLARHPSFKNRSLTLDLDMGLSLDKDFERVIETQKVAFDLSYHKPTLTPHQSPSRQVSTHQLTELDMEEVHANITSRPQRGYLMRQNTKLVSASDKDGEESWRARANSNSPIKTAVRPQSWTVEPWNGQTRRSIRKATATGGGPVPPMPGRESNIVGLNRVVEEDISADMAAPETGERGRLFVKVVGVKDLDLPIPKNERSWFSLTLDNGVHCVTTAWLELARNAPIGQEFELVVPNDLEFQLTLNVKLEKPSYPKVQAPTAKMAKPKTSTFSRVFASPKKRKELEQRQKAEEERFAQEQREALARERKNAGSAYELLSPFAAEDGSFARAYVCLKEHETRCFGRPYIAEVACFNEWATEEESFASSVKSKRGNGTIVRRAPYKIGKLELQLLFVPRPKNVTDDDMPKSMNSCIRELKAAEERQARNWEGHLSQHGGDCPYWRRRYFKLVGTKLTAYHEATRQPRATINLSNTKRLIDDRRALTEKDTPGKGGKRRRSAFAEEEEGYMFVEEGFRIRFNNGEVIDFYADTAEDKEGWMKALADVIGRGDVGLEDDGTGPRSRAKWCELVLKREEQSRRRSESKRVHSRSKSMFT
ncbi:Bud site selection protein BUD4 [Cladobotryum mycophilum]|uniref:Bud site selection protein BUD4 n=1 Tax=Cladobotryum mycophilum TaxID=491253 RepID=A0ABR0SEJ1_9HYPO